MKRKLSIRTLTHYWSALLLRATLCLLVWIAAAPVVHGQGTLTFNQPKYTQNYYEQGFWFRVIPNDDPLKLLSGLDDLVFAPSTGSYYVSISLTGGGTFGLSSVDLHGNYYNGTTVQFDGYFGDGSMVPKTFTVPYNFQRASYQFGSEFSSGLVRVGIPSYPWAMDNLVFTVPEPSVLSLFVLGLSAFRRKMKQGKGNT
jgi:hypothetical protein